MLNYNGLKSDIVVFLCNPVSGPIIDCRKAKCKENAMTITDIKIRKVFDNDGPMKAIASVTFDGALAVHDVKVIYARERYFIVMPCKKNPDGTYRDIVHPINAEFRRVLEEAVIARYHGYLSETNDGENE